MIVLLVAVFGVVLWLWSYCKLREAMLVRDKASEELRRELRQWSR